VLVANSAWATQYVEGGDKDHAEVNISANEQNRISVDGRRIASAVPSLKGALTYAKDEAAGALYFALSSDVSNSGTLTLFVTDDQNTTYKLILVPRPIAGEEIIIRPPVDRNPKPPSARGAISRRASSYERRADDLLFAMATEKTGNLDPSVVNKEVPLWKEARCVFLEKYFDDDLIGEKYSLTNISKKDMLLVEQELYRKGVISVSIENMTLAPGGSTLFYIVRERKDNE
jgi:conjugal transfer pilus assembly protein TraK